MTTTAIGRIGIYPPANLLSGQKVKYSVSVIATASEAFLSRFRVPLIAAPMTGVSSCELVAAAAASGIGASFPVHNAGSPAEVDRWLDRLRGLPGPVMPNLIVHKSNQRLTDDLDVVISHRVPAVITSVGSPLEVVGPLHDAGILVFSDVASMRHVERAIAVGVDGLVLLSAGAGGQTGWINPLVFVRAVRRVWDGPLVLAGGVTDGTSMLAARVAGYDLVYMGTPFIATEESAADQAYMAAVVAASVDDIVLTSELTGLPTSMIRPESPVGDRLGAVGDFTMSVLGEGLGNAPDSGPGFRFSAGHSAVAVDRVLPASELIARVEEEYNEARALAR